MDALASGIRRRPLRRPRRPPPDEHSPSRRAACLLSAHDDEMLPPTIGEGGVELWAVCGRKVIKAEEPKRETAAERAAPEGVRDPLQEAPQGSASGRPYRVPVMSRGPRSSGALPLAVSMGDPAGIGLEITLKAWRERRDTGLPPFVLLRRPRCRRRARAHARARRAPQAVVARRRGAGCVRDGTARAAPSARRARRGPASPEPANAPAIIAAIEEATAAVVRGEAAAIVTNPIAKHVLCAARASPSRATPSSSPRWPSATSPASAFRPS